MNLPIEICAIVESFLPLQFNRRTEKRIWEMARSALNKGYPNAKHMNTASHMLMSGFGSKTFRIEYGGISYGSFKIESKYLEIEIQQLDPNMVNPYSNRPNFNENEFILHLSKQDDNPTVQRPSYHFLVRLIQ